MIYTDSESILKAIQQVVTACNLHGMAVPKAQDILVAIVASKLCKENTPKVIQSAAPHISMHLRQLHEKMPGFAKQIQAKAIDALNALTLGNLSTNAPKNGNFLAFAQHMGTPVPNELTQLMYFTIGRLNDAESHLWHSNLMLHALNMTETEITSDVLPRVKAFAATVEPERLTESYAQLLAGITFDLKKLDPVLLAAADLPCQRPVYAKEDRQQLRADLYYLTKELKALKANANPAMITQKDVDDFYHLRTFVKAATEKTQRQAISVEQKKAQSLKVKFKDCQLSEGELCDNLRKQITEKRQNLAILKQKVNHGLLEKAGQSSVLIWEMPSVNGLGSMDLRTVLREVESKVVLMEQFKKTSDK
jgi:hypothetical protein